MKKKFSVEQIVSVLKQAEVGVRIAELIRKMGITEKTYYRWKAKYAGLETCNLAKFQPCPSCTAGGGLKSSVSPPWSGKFANSQ